MKICYIEPYLGFSHKHWIEGYKKHSSNEIAVVGLPARHWKWRMHGGAITLAKKVEEGCEVPDLFLISGMIDLPLFKSLLPSRFSNVPMQLYFHENQFAYPHSDYQDGKRNEHFSFINMKSALVADKVYFNSEYNLKTFLEGSLKLVKKMPDFSNAEWVEEIRKKSKVLALGMDYLKKVEVQKMTTPPLLLWNHRWEYDKNPELFFETLFELDDEGLDFELAILGESFRTSPAIFETAKERLKNKIKYWGFQSREDYERIVHQATLLPVTSNQDFFGISVIEAAAAGVRPLLPKRLAYPEHFPKEYFFSEDGEFLTALRELIESPKDLSFKDMEKIKSYSWEFMAKEYDDEFSLN
ncbi:MAG: glycosyl transferase family 1 [Halobacteriovorax sp.]|nr:glycosyl transferase family 1 [Halobacteriovorax sp.]